MAKNDDEMSANEMREFVSDHYCMVRDCEFYYDEYKECKSIKGRFHQKFVFGEFSDCSTWYEDYKNCRKFLENEDLKAGVKNDVWTKRSEPPPEWNAKLPDWLEERQKDSFASQNEVLNNTCAIS